MDTARKHPNTNTPTRKPPPPPASHTTPTYSYEDLERQIALRDPGLANLIERNKRQRASGAHSVTTTRPTATTTLSSHTQEEVGEEESEEESEEDGAAEDGYNNNERGSAQLEYDEMDEDNLYAEEEEEEKEEEEDEEEEEEDDEGEEDEEDEEDEDGENERDPEETEDLQEESGDEAVERHGNADVGAENGVKGGRRASSRTPSYEDEDREDEDRTEGEGTEDEEEESVYSEYPEEEEEYPTDPLVIEEIEKFQATFRGIEKRFRLINKIGEGTFSSVYKAEDLLYDRYDNSWDLENTPPPSQRNGTRPPKYVAIKKIYVTSSPARIQNELELLHDLTGCKSIVPLVTAFRCQDQVVAILPYFRHVDFREYFRNLTINDVVLYVKSLFSALEHVHEHDIIHRDIKPTNFLYDFYKGRGVLCDFGLAERVGTDSSYCACQHSNGERKGLRLPSSTTALSQGYPKNDSRPSRRANRAGTRGFRAPEVLFKCTYQTTKIDIWSAGVILLTILSKRFPFFNSSDDVDAIIEIATIFGKAKMRACAALHGCMFETTIPTIGEKGFTLEKIVLWATGRSAGGGSSSADQDLLPEGERLACHFLARCFELDPAKRISATEALRHEFLNYEELEEDEDEDEDDGEYEDGDEEGGYLS